MKLKLWITLAMTCGSAALSGCTPVVFAAAGAGAVLVADSAAEDNKGGDGLF